MRKPKPTQPIELHELVRLATEIDVDEWDLGDAEDLVEFSGTPFDQCLEILQSGDYRRISPGLLVALLRIEGRREGYTREQIRATKLVDVLKALAAAGAINTTGDD